MSLRNLLVLLVLAVVSPRLAAGHGLHMTFHVANGKYTMEAPAYNGPVVDPVGENHSVL
jgi:hypothetical protein